MGVDVFFVLSGYLITTLLLEENARSARISLRNFYTRRALRLYPALLAMILLGLPFYSLLGNGGTLPGYGQAALIAGIYVQDFVNGFIGDPQGEFGHTWSLAVEEQFYLIWPIALILMLKFRARLMPWTLVAAGLTTATLVTLSFQESADGISDRAYYLPWSRFSALLVGCVIAIALKRGVRPAVVRRPWFGVAALLAVIALTLAASHFGRFPHLAWEAPAIALSSAALVWHLSSSASPVATLLGVKPLAWLGRRSYGIYLYHLPVMIVLGAYLSVRRSVLTLLVLMVTIVVAAVSYRFIEMPFLRMKGRLSRPAGSAPLVPAGSGISNEPPSGFHVRADTTSVESDQSVPGEQSGETPASRP